MMSLLVAPQGAHLFIQPFVAIHDSCEAGQRLCWLGRGHPSLHPSLHSTPPREAALCCVSHRWCAVISKCVVLLTMGRPMHRAKSGLRR